MARGHDHLHVLRASPRTAPLLGGQEVHVEELTRALADLGFKQTLLFAAGEGSSVPGVEKVACPWPLPSSNIARDAMFGAWVASRSAMEKPDVIHTHGDAPVARGGKILALRTGAVHVHTFHSRLAAEAARRTVLSLMLPRRSQYLAVSSRVAQTMVEAGVPRRRIWIRPSGVRQAFLETPFGKRKSLVAAGGRLVPMKGIRRLAERWPAEGDVELRIFGAGPEETSIEAIAAVKATVTWLGRLDGSQLADVFAQATVGVVLTSEPVATESGEGTPTLALEMLASGCWPVVSSETGAAPSLIGELGFGEVMSSTPEPDDLIAITDRVQRASLGEDRKRVRDAMRNRHSWPAAAKAIASFYQDLAVGRW